MKQLIFSLLVLFLATSVQAGGIDFFQGTWEEALEKAKKEDKLIFVDAYTTWCGPCKRMSKQVFPQEAVGEFYNKNFVSMKIDMEKTPGKKFQRKYPVSAFPTLYYIDGDGKVAHVTKGGKNPEQFIQLGKMAMKKNDKSGDYEADYKEGKRDYDLVYNYVKALNKAGKPSLKIANDYIKSQKDLTTEENLKFILEATTEADSRIFDLLIKHKTAITGLTSAEEVNDRIEAACMRTADKAIEYKYYDLITEATAKLRTAAPEKADAFEQTHAMRYHAADQEPAAYLKSADKLAKIYKKNPDNLHKLAVTVVKQFDKNPQALKQAERYAKSAASSGTDIAYYFTQAQILKKMGKSKDAIKVAEKAKKMAKGDMAKEKAAEQLIQSLGR